MRQTADRVHHAALGAGCRMRAQIPGAHSVPLSWFPALCALLRHIVGGRRVMMRADPGHACHDQDVNVSVAHADITGQHVDAIVNAANSRLLGGGGVDGAIHRAGGPQILAECRRLRDCRYPQGLPTGEAVATTAGRLPANWVIHTVGPVYHAHQDRSDLLESCYRRSLAVAAGLGASSVAFPLISSGLYRWPVLDAIRIALTVLHHDDSVADTRLVLFDAATHQHAQRALADIIGQGLTPERLRHRPARVHGMWMI
jgi:O-acetyl-ADP-ribose deacetylase (regulator of RNase III)